MRYALVVSLVQEAGKRRKSAAHQELQIAQLTPGEIPRWPFAGVRFQLTNSFRFRNEVYKCAAMRHNKMAG